MVYRFSLRFKTRLSSEALEERLAVACRATYTFNLEGIEARNGDTYKIMRVTFVSEEDLETFKRILHGA